MASAWMTFLCSAGVLLLSAIWMWKRRGRKDQLPHYRGWPVFGNFFQVRRERPELTFTEWAKDLGPVFSVKMLHTKFVVLSSFDAIHEALVEKGNSFSGRPNDQQFRLQTVTDHFSDFGSMQPTPTWRTLRKVCHNKIKMYDTGMRKIEELNSNLIKNLVDDFKSRNKSFDPKEIVYNTTMNTILMLLLGRTFNTGEELFQKLLRFEQLLNKTITSAGRGAELDIFPWLRYFGNTTYKNLMESIKLRNEIWELMKEEASRGDQLLEGDEEDVRLVTALREALAKKEFGLSERHLRAVAMFDLTLPATSTSSNSLLVFLNLLCQYPGIQTKLQEEVDTIVGSERCVSLADKDDMPYTQATILELLRYSSIAPLAVPHKATVDTTIQGKYIKAGATILVNLYCLHHDEDFWKNPFEFQPERFLDENENLHSASHPNRHHLMPFGAGPRVCVGKILAQSRLFLIISSLAQKFHIRPGEVWAPCDPRTLLHGFILSAAYFEIHAEERK